MNNKSELFQEFINTTKRLQQLYSEVSESENIYTNLKKFHPWGSRFNVNYA